MRVITGATHVALSVSTHQNSRSTEQAQASGLTFFPPNTTLHFKSFVRFMLQHFNTTSHPTWNVNCNELRQQQQKNWEICWIKSINGCSPVALQYLRYKKNICANAVSKRPPSSVLKGHRLALVPASHSLKHLSMAFLLSQLPTLTVGMILRGWSHWTKRFSSRKLLCSLYGIPVRKGRRELFFSRLSFLIS